MENPFLSPLNQRAYNSSSSHYDDDDALSSRSFNVPVSHRSGSTITYETTASGRNSATIRPRVSEMVKMFEGTKPQSARTTPVHRIDSIAIPSSSLKAQYMSGGSVKQFVNQLQDGDDQSRCDKQSSEKNRRNSGVVGITVGRAGLVLSSPCRPGQYPDGMEEMVKRTEKFRRLAGSGCPVGTGIYGLVPSNQAKPFLPQFHEIDGDSAKATERCPCCNVLYRCDEIHYCLGNKKGGSITPMEQNHGDGSSAGNRPNVGLKTPYSVVENRNNDYFRSPLKEMRETKTRETRRIPAELFEDIEGIPVSLSYDSKTTIIRTPNGVRIVVDISLDSMSNMPNGDVVCSRFETDMAHSRILNEFQQKSAMVMAGADVRL